MRTSSLSSRISALSILTITLASLLQGHASACSVPVFRYSLERWKTSAYTVRVFHRGELTDEQQALVQKLRNATANLKVMTIDLDGEVTREQAALWKLRGKTTLPWVIVHYPEEDEEPLPA